MRRRTWCAACPRCRRRCARARWRRRCSCGRAGGRPSRTRSRSRATRARARCTRLRTTPRRPQVPPARAAAQLRSVGRPRAARCLCRAVGSRSPPRSPLAPLAPALCERLVNVKTKDPTTTRSKKYVFPYRTGCSFSIRSRSSFWKLDLRRVYVIRLMSLLRLRRIV